MTALAKVRHEQFEDIDEGNEFLPEHASESVQLEPSPAISDYHQVAYPDLIVTKMTETFARADDYRVPDGQLGVALPLLGPGRAIWCGFELAHDVLVTQPAERDLFTVMPASGFGLFQIIIDEELLERWGLMPPKSADRHDDVMSQLVPISEEVAAEFREWLDSWFETPDRADTLARDPVSSAEFRDHEEAP